jgi:hypothetical protein
MKVSRQRRFSSRRKGVRSFLVASLLAVLALLVSPANASSLGVLEVDGSDNKVETLSLFPEIPEFDNTLLGPRAESRADRVVTETGAGTSTEDEVTRFLATTKVAEPGVLIGMYTSASLQVTAYEIGQVEAWLSENGLDQQIAIAGTFMDIEFPNPEWNIPHDLDAAWDQGAVPFVNLAVGTAGLGPRSAYDVASGAIDDAIRQWASIFAQWTQGGRRWAYVAPLQEMNAGWVSYGLDPENYKLAFTRIQRIFVEEGVPEGAVLWVFAPNGWSQPGHEFEKYYPGDEVVDVVGFSAFNFGACVASGEGWDPYEEAIHPYMERMEAMAPEKPIFLAQTGSVKEGGDRGAWLVDTLENLAQVKNFRGLIYFNVSKVEAGAPSCNPVDWRVYDPEIGVGEEGFIQALQILGGGATVVPSNLVFLPMIIQ